MKCLFLDYIQLLMISQVIQVTKVAQNVKNGHQIVKKCSFLDYVQFMMISRATILSKNEMLIFGLHSTSDDQWSNPSDESQPKCEKMANKLSKNEKNEIFFVAFIFWLICVMGNYDLLLLLLLSY